MKKGALIVLCLLCLFKSEAKHKKTKTKKRTTTEEKTQIPSNTLVVSFISKASGIDRMSSNELVKEYHLFDEKNKDAKLVFNMVSWGREGERDYCFTAANQKSLDSFAKIITEKFKGNERIFVTENGKCREKRN